MIKSFMIASKKQVIVMGYFLFIIFIVAIDLWSKKKAFKLLKEKNSPYKLGKGLQLRLALNSGGFYGLLKNKKGWIIILNLIALIGCIILLVLGFYIKDFTSYALGLSFIIGGGIGNLIDRIKRGYVIDFLYFKGGPVFNIADIFIFLGALILIYIEIF